MGNRTVVILYNDNTHQWMNDPDLGKKIDFGANHCFMNKSTPGADLGFGRVVECAHADDQTLAILEGYRLNVVAHNFWNRTQTFDDVQAELLRAWADRRGYRLVKKSEKK